MKLVQYLNGSGEFDYARYRRIQTDGNKAKLANTWTYRPTIEYLSAYILRTVGKPSFGICHGTRRGDEQIWFREFLGVEVEVVGTEISDTATSFPHTIQHDFHEPRSDWVGKADFVYSNSWDHAYNPARAFSVWMQSLRPGGITILEHTMSHLPEYTSEMDPFGATLDELVEFLTQLGKQNNFYLCDVLKQFGFPVPAYMGFLSFVILKNR